MRVLADFLSPCFGPDVIIEPYSDSISASSAEFFMRVMLLCCCLLLAGCNMREYRAEEADPTSAEECNSGDCCSSVTRASMLQKSKGSNEPQP
jgi:hypothetical protein